MLRLWEALAVAANRSLQVATYDSNPFDSVLSLFSQNPNTQILRSELGDKGRGSR